MSTLDKSRRRQQSHRSASRRLFLEGLENRSVLAGDVLALATGGHLMIHGDGDANGVHIQTMADGTVQVSGIEAGGSATTIKGSSEPFLATNSSFMTRVHLGNGDDVLQIDSQASSETNAGESEGNGGSNTGGNSSNNSTLGSTIRDRLRDLFESLGLGNGNNFQARDHLLINTGNGSDTVQAEVDADLDVHLTGNLRGDRISIQTNAGDDLDASGSTGVNASTVASVDADTAIGTDVGADLDASANANVDSSAAAAVTSALNANLNAAVDATANATLGGIGLNSDLDTNLVASLASNAALNSSSYLGTNSLLNNTDANLNGAIGGSAALNLAGDAVFDEFGLFNLASLANMNAQAAATTAMSNASTFGLSTDAIDDFFASSQANANADIGVLGTLGFQDQMGNGSLNTNISSGFNSTFQARNGLVPVG